MEEKIKQSQITRISELARLLDERKFTRSKNQKIQMLKGV